jgi:cellulose 1,4-beta-cellobiosidase
MNLRRISLAVTVLLVIVATFFGAALPGARAATVCTPTSTVSAPYVKDGAGDICVQVASLCTYINSWNLTTLEINGTSYLNQYVFTNTIAPLNGTYTIHYVSTVAWGHFESGGTCSGGVTPTTPVGPTFTPTRTPTRTNTPTTPVGPTFTPTRTPTRTNTPTTPVGPTFTPTRTPTATTPVGPTFTPTRTPTNPPQGTHLPNPFSGANFYVNQDWNGHTTFNVPTFVWLDSIDAVNGTNGYAHSLAGHLDAALAQGRNGIEIVIYDLPNRDCSALASNGELLIASGGTAKYRTQYIDVIYSIISQAKYAGLRIVAVIEPDSLPNLVTNSGIAKCSEAMSATDGYVVNTQYTLNKLHPLSNFYAYIDIGHAGWLGWSSNFGPAITLISNMIKGTTAGAASVDGFVDNTANTQVETEPFLNASMTVGGQQIIGATFFSFNPYIEEDTFDTAWKSAMISAGIPSANSNMILDTSRNGWGGCGGGVAVSQQCRPTAVSTSTDLNTFVNMSRIDRRPAKGDWCNQNGAGIGKLPGAGTGPYQAYVWVKPPGESDGSSSLIPTGPNNPGGKGFDQMCDPNYGGNSLNQNMNSNALPNAPVSGMWFAAQFTQLVANKFP